MRIYGNGRRRTDAAVIETLEKRLVFSSLSISDATGVEGAFGQTIATFTVSLDAAAGTPVTVDYSTQDLTATAGADYNSVSGQLIFNAGETRKAIDVPIIGDTIQEPAETFLVNLSNPSGAELADTQGVGTIINLPSKTINLSAKKRASYVDASGDKVSMSLVGPGSGQILFFSTDNSDASIVTLTGTTGKSSLMINGGRGGTSVTQIQVDGSLNRINGSTADLQGSLDLTGSLLQLTLRSASGEITVGSSGQIANLNITNATELSLTAPSVKNIKVGQWKREAGQMAMIMTASIASIVSRGSFGADMKLTSSSASLGKMVVGGSLLNSNIRAAGSIGPILAGAVVNSRIFAGVDASVTGTPTALADFANTGASIRSITVRKGSVFTGTDIAAPMIGDLNLAKVGTANHGVIFAIVADKIGSYGGISPSIGPFKFKNLDAAQNTLEDDLRLQIL